MARQVGSFLKLSFVQVLLSSFLDEVVVFDIVEVVVVSVVLGVFVTISVVITCSVEVVFNVFGTYFLRPKTSLWIFDLQPKVATGFR